jgi:hypothetical protein
LTADVSKSRAEAFPGFSRSEFEKLTDTDMDQMAYSSVQACSDEPIDRTVGWASWTQYEYPSWWDASYYRPAGTTAAGSIGSTAAARASSGISSGSSAAASTASRDRDRELVTARGGETSPHAGDRAQPGDVIGVETGGEQTHIGDTAKDEDERRRDAEKAAAKDRR